MTLFHTLLLGTGATALMDLWGVLRQPLLGQATPNYALLGRWLGHMPRGRFIHPAIAKATPVPGERILGWTAHYLIGIGFAAALLVLAGPHWLRQPTLAPALVTGIVTVAAPFLVMQPAMGAGIAAARTPNPASARAQSLVTHLVFGLGLYAAGRAINLLLVS